MVPWLGFLQPTQEIPGLWLRYGPANASKGILEVNQHIEDLFSSLSHSVILPFK